MSKVLFANTYFYRLDAKQWRFKQPYPPLGTLQAAAVIREAGHNTSVFDVSLTSSPADIEPEIQKTKPDYFIVYDDGFNYLTKMCLTIMREAAFAMARLAKQHGCTVIINSSDATDHYKKYFAHGVDYAVLGEGEETLLGLITCLSKGDDPHTVKGISFLHNGEPVTTSLKPVLRNLDALPLPAWDLIDLTPYKSIWKKYHGYFSLNLATTRGCPYKCNWCAKPIYGNRYNSRSPQHVIREIEWLLTTHKPDHFWMCDDIFGLKPHWITEFNNIVHEKKLSFRYKIQSRVDLLLEANSIQSLAESGCETVWVGAESGSQKILDAMDKGTSLDQIRSATHLLRRHGIRVGFFLQFGYPGETREDIESTLQLVLNLMPEEIGISVSYPLPGTKFYQQVKDQLLEKQNWTDSDDLAMMYHSTFPLGYYKVLQRYVHSRYRIQRGLDRMKQLFQKPAFRGSDFRKIVSMLYNIPVSQIHAHQLKRLSALHG